MNSTEAKHTRNTGMLPLQNWPLLPSHDWFHVLLLHHRFYGFFSTHIKRTIARAQLILFCLPLVHADDILFFYTNLHRSLRFSIIIQSTYVILNVLPKFIRSMLHSVICNDLIRLLKLCCGIVCRRPKCKWMCECVWMVLCYELASHIGFFSSPQ